MKVGIMQPYFLPYIGYWQLLNVVEKYILLDDVNFINRGWINRNRILINGKASYLNVSIIGASQNKLINEIEVNHDEKLIKKNLEKVWFAYKRAPEFHKIFPLFEDIMTSGEKNLAGFNVYSIKVICRYLSIDTELILSSAIPKDNFLKGEAKILDLCKLMNTTMYINAIGGRELYKKENFLKNDIELFFLKTGEIVYKQFNDKFVDSLSILDVLMFNSAEKVRLMMSDFKLI